MACLIRNRQAVLVLKHLLGRPKIGRLATLTYYTDRLTRLDNILCIVVLATCKYLGSLII